MTDFYRLESWNIITLRKKKVLMEQEEFFLSFKGYDNHSMINDERRIFIYACVRSLVEKVCIGSRSSSISSIVSLTLRDATVLNRSSHTIDQRYRSETCHESWGVISGRRSVLYIRRVYVYTLCLPSFPPWCSVLG